MTVIANTGSPMGYQFPTVAPQANASMVPTFRQNIKTWVTVLICASFVLGLSFKTVIFVDREPVLINYTTHAFLISIMAIIAFQYSRFLIDLSFSLFILIAATMFATISAVNSGLSLNIVAVGTFTVVWFGSFFIMPLMCFWVGVEPWRVICYVTCAIVPLSVILMVISPELTIDPLSGRFRGAMVSVAYGGLVFSLACLLSARAAMVASALGYKLAFGALSVTALYLLYLTLTRSSLAETVACVGLLAVFGPLNRQSKMVIFALMAILAVGLVLSGVAVSSGIVSIDDQLESFRLADRQLVNARDLNWEFGLERIAASRWFGEGLLTKQTQGGTSTLDFSAATNYDQSYDPHSLAISLGVQGGIPFMIAILFVNIWVIMSFIRVFGLKNAFQSPEFVFVSIHFAAMNVAGGDLTTMGNIVERIYWVLLGTLALKAAIKGRTLAPSGRTVDRGVSRTQTDIATMSRHPAP